MQYNTTRGPLKIGEYGRSVQEMVAHIKSLPDKEQRTKAANTLVQIMITLNPQLKEQSEYKHKLWDHLFMMADYDLDVDSPFEKPDPIEKAGRPEKPAYASNHIRFRYYGKNVERMIAKATEMEDGPEKQAMVNALGSYMKMAYRVWNEDHVPDEIIINHIDLMSKGALKPTEIKTFAVHSEEYKPRQNKQNRPNKKKKHFRKQ
jgi:hypothetical protein